MNYMDLPNPVHIGDTVSVEIEIAETNELESRDDVGLVVLETEMTTQEETVVFQGDLKFFVCTADQSRIDS